MAFTHQSDFQHLSINMLLTKLKAEEAVLKTANVQLNQPHSAQVAISPAVEWFRDNFYLVEQVIDQLSQELPQKGKPAPDGYPKIYALAFECLSACENLLDIEQAIPIIRTYQLKDQLLMSEIRALPTMFRWGIIGNLAAAVEHQWLAPDSSFPRIEATQQDPSFMPLKGDLGDHSADWTFIGVPEARFSKRRDTEIWEKGASDDEQIVINCLCSLRTLSAQDWRAFFEAVSCVEAILKCDPASVYVSMDFETKDIYRGSIEELALTTGWEESAIASECVNLASSACQGKPGLQQNSTEPLLAQHVGYYLVGKGRPFLEAALDYSPDWKTRLRNGALKHTQVLYLGTIALLTTAFSAMLGWGVWHAEGNLIQVGSAILIALIPFTNIVTLLTNRISAHFIPPKPLPKMNFDDGIPSGFKAMAVIPAIVSDTDEVDFLLDQIEQHYLSNPDRCLGFALLTDFLDAPQKHMSGDHVLLDRLSRGVRTLNEYYGQQDRGHFYLFHRYRTWNRVEGCWMGWERKRGKLIEFNRLMNGEKTSFDIQIGDLSFLSGIRYVITLDTDTRLPRESARRLIATLAHPLNQAEFDRNQSQFIAGYTILQPRVDIHPASWNHSHFTQIFAVETGLDLYTHAVSNVYQDLFGEGIYIGKGIYEVAPFQRVSDKRIPENTVISHDLLEGLYGRVGLVSDVVFYEDFPLHYLSFVSRLRRWVRGDWQLLPWLFHQIPHAENRRERSPFGMLGRWKIFNNLLHSLHRPALSGLLLAGWLWLPSDAWVWTVIVVLISASEHLYGIFTRSHRGLLGGQNIRLLPLLGNRFWRWIMALLFLPFESWICLNAITSTLIRLFVTRKHLLRWTANAHILSQFGKDIKSKKYWQYMLVGPLFGLGMFWLITFFNPAALITASPLLIAWLISPQIAWWISRPAPYPTLSFSPEDQHLLHKVTRRTWSYFERSIGPQTNWLPLDNLQEAPAPYQVVKTSPTNLGLALLSTMAAADSGYIGPRQLATRLEKAIMSLECLPRHNGHFFNWYDIQKLSPVLPHYVSFVDSGNLAACLLAMKQGLKEVSRRPALNGDRWQGLIDTIAVLTEYVVPYHENRSLMNNISHLQNLARLGRDSTGQLDTCSFRMLEKEWQTISKKLLVLTQDACHDTDGGSLHQITFWVERVDLHLATLWSDVRMLTPWLLALEHSPAFFSKAHANPAIAHTWRAFFAAVSVNSDLEELPAICTHGLKHIEHLSTILSALENPSPEAGVALHWCMNLMKEMQTARKSARKLLHSLQKIRCWAEKTFSEMDFGFLFNSQRKVFSVGYNLDNGRLDLSSYDILASEARLASLIAIAKNDVPQDHWAHMARPFAWLNGEPALLSWGGSLFEYLMPTLLARTIPGSLLDGACRIAISGHIAVGNRKSLPWGLSESSCYPFDASQGYQYCSFGVKELAVNSKLGERQVIAPYATALALPFQPRDALNNLVRLIGLGMLGPYGLYEAIDFTLSPSTSFKQGTIVPIYMTHHQGMVMLSLVNCTQHHVMVHRFHADPRIQTVELLLWEVPIPHRNIKVRARDIKRFKLPLRGSPSNLA